LPAHSSHVLQPLDVAVFGPVKRYYTSHLGRHPTISDSSPIGKSIFLQCYLKARELGMTEKNIIAGWRAAGLWPRNMAKPLLSPLLLTKPPQAIVTPEKPQTPQQNLPIEINTPSNSRGVKRLFSNLNYTQKLSPTSRLILRKIQKGIDKKNSQIIASETKINHLEQQLTDLRMKKRAKVIPNPNKSFVTVLEVEKTRRQLNRQLLGIEEAGIIDFSDADISDSEAVVAQLCNN
jgi:hypothetical protein